MANPIRPTRFLPVLALLLAPAMAFAQDEEEDENEDGTEQFDACEVCEELDDIEEACEALFGDGAVPCENIGTVEEACPQGEGDEEDDGEEADDGNEGAPGAECPDLCAEVPALLDTCTAELGADHEVCAELSELITEDCAGSNSGNAEARRGAIATCDAGIAAGSGGALTILIAGTALIRRRRSR